MERRRIRGRGQPSRARLGSPGVDAREAHAFRSGSQRLLSDESARESWAANSITAAFSKCSGNRRSLRVLHLEHHLCHAASAFYASDADRAVVLTLDEQGDGRAGCIALGEGTQLRILESIPFPNSPAWIFSQVTDLIGFTPHADEHKTQWLGLEGDPVFESLFLEILRRSPGKLPRLATAYFNAGLAGHIAFSPKFYRAVGVDPAIGKAAETGSPRPPIPEPLRKQLAASVQQACGMVAAELAERYRKQTGAKSSVSCGRIVSESGRGFARGKKHRLRSRFRSARRGE